MTPADTSKAAADNAYTTPGDHDARTTPASSGPAKMQPLAIHPAATLKAVSSSGSRTSAGASTAWAGRVIVTSVNASAENA